MQGDNLSRKANISMLCTSIPVQVGFDIVHRRIHNQFSNEMIFGNEFYDLIIEGCMDLLILNNCLFLQNMFYRQLQETAMGSPYSPAIANIA